MPNGVVPGESFGVPSSTTSLFGRTSLTETDKGTGSKLGRATCKSQQAVNF